MPGNLSDFAEKLALDFLLTTGTATRPTAWYLGLFTATPGDAGGGTEVSGNGYARQTVTHGAAASGTGQAASSNAPTFTAAGGGWGSIVGVGVYDALTGGNLIYWCPLDVAKTVNDGDTLAFPAGNLKLTLD